MTNAPLWRFPTLMTAIGCAVFLAVFIAGTHAVKAGVEVDNAIALDPFDPVPEIQFNHYGGYYWGHGYRHYRDCYGYGRCDGDYRGREHAWGRYEEQADRYDWQSCWYAHRYMDGRRCPEGPWDEHWAGHWDGHQWDHHWDGHHWDGYPPPDGWDGHDGHHDDGHDGRRDDGQEGHDGHDDGHDDGHNGHDDHDGHDGHDNHDSHDDGQDNGHDGWDGHDGH